MRSPLAALTLAVMLATVVCAPGESGRSEPTRLTESQGGEILRAHNDWREKAGVLPLRWEAELAILAQARADNLAARGCQLDHGDLPDEIGENLLRADPARSKGRPDAVRLLAPAEVVGAWASEADDYSHEENRCALGRQCGHYTQMIWAETRALGCGTAVCPSAGQVWVCNYRPGGNVRGQRPY